MPNIRKSQIALNTANTPNAPKAKKSKIPPNTPKILQLGKFFPPDIGGIERVMADICAGINARGLACDCLVSNSRYAFSYEILPLNSHNPRIFRTASYGRLARTARERFLAHFTLEKMIDLVYECYLSQAARITQGR